MKIRNGFVSNSSSSSYVVGRHYYENVWDLAWQMVALRHWDTDEKLIEKLMDNMVFGEPEQDISFPTCNYDTFIHIEGDNFWIGTCHNHSFWQLFKNKTHVGELPHTVPITDRRGYKYDADFKDYLEMYMEEDFDFLRLE